MNHSLEPMGGLVAVEAVQITLVPEVGVEDLMVEAVEITIWVQVCGDLGVVEALSMVAVHKPTKQASTKVMERW